MKIAICLGTRPEIIKLAPVIKELDLRRVDYLIIHTNQHYDYQMDQIFFKELGLRIPDFNINAAANSHSLMLAKMLPEIEKILLNEKVDSILVQGDTNSTLAGALAASKIGVKIIHLEAGARSFDKSMPEEINRILVDSITDIFLTATETDKKNLVKEGVAPDKIEVVGSTILESAALAEERISESRLEGFKITPKKYALVTIHRASNVDTQENLQQVMEQLEFAQREYYQGKKFIWPMHPRTKSKISEYNLQLPGFIQVIEPVGYLDLIALTKYALIVFTDSGGVQEEAFSLKVPCVTLRDITEWVYTVEKKGNFTVGYHKKKMKLALNFFKDQTPDWTSPYAKGIAQRVVDLILKT